MFKITIPTKESGQIYVTNMLTRGRRTCLRQCRTSSGVGGVGGVGSVGGGDCDIVVV